MENKKQDKEQEMKEYKKQYYAKNKDNIAEKLYAKEKCPCCGKKVNHQHMTKHQKTPRCIKKRSDNIDMLLEVKQTMKKFGIEGNDSYFDNLIKHVMNIKD